MFLRLSTSRYTHRETHPESETSRKPGPEWLLAISLQSVVLPLWFGKSGFAASAVATALLVTIAAAKVWRVSPGQRLYGFLILTLMYLNTDAITATVARSVPRASWLLLAMLTAYALLDFRHISLTVTQHPELIALGIFLFLQIAWAVLLDSSTMFSVAQRSVSFYLVFLVTASLLLTGSVNEARALLYMCLMAGVNSAISLILEYSYPQDLGMSSSIVLGAERAAGLFLNAGAAAFVVSFSALGTVWLGRAKVVSRFSVLMALAIMLSALLTTFSTQGVFSFVLIVFGIGFMFLPVRSRGLLLPIVVIVCSLWALTSVSRYLLMENIPFVQSALTRANYRRTINSVRILSGDYRAVLEAMSSSNRTQYLQYTWQAIQRRPWLGYGTDYSSILHPDFKPHNMFLLVWVENGVFMLLFLLVMLIRVIGGALLTFDSERWYRMLLVGNLLVFMMARHVLFFYRYLAIILAVIFVLNKVSLTTQMPVQSRARVRVRV